ncbi:hypothetical protein [Aliiroseovarius lamellibrachiae]|uniref:hypothetical protein n=1 Tax=Aliiroseovarius lamellibrachiae TaxID=1924933 RepID=UPI001BE0EAE7|nr:hypothetical protein [Aliiroseovarius lamellibrachiae]
MHLLQEQLIQKRRALGVMLRLVSALRKTRIGVIALIWMAIWIYPKAWFSRGKPKQVYIVSLTENNKSALQRVTVLFEERIAINCLCATLLQRLRSMCMKRREVDLLLKSGSKEDFLFLHQIAGVACAILFTEDWRQSRPQLVMAANDHSPATVSLFALARAYQLRSCYVQHGSVTESFPPLRYDLSVLYNERSIALYSASANRCRLPEMERSKIFLLPPQSAPFCKIAPPSSPFTVYIALSFFPNLTVLDSMLADLVSQPQVSSVTLCPHPRCQLNLAQFANRDGVDVSPKGLRVKDVVNQGDVCIVSNSGVALELLRAGCPTFFWDQGDLSTRDYYGFVAEKILPVFDMEWLADPKSAVAFFDVNWVSRMASFDSAVETDPTVLELNLRQALAEFEIG